MMQNTDKIREVIAATFKLPVGRVPADAAIEKLSQWDSIGHVNLMIAIEQEFDLYLEPEDFAKLTSVDAIAAFINDARANA